MKNRVVFISGLSHVGSTLVDFTLGSQPNFVGLGEIYTALRPELNLINRDIVCSCGKVIDECDFWKKAAKRIRPRMASPMSEKYRIIIDTFKKIYGDESILVDSSKFLPALQAISSVPGIDLKVINLIRDVRSWVISRLDIRSRNPQDFTPSGFYVTNLSHTFGWKARAARWMIPYMTRMPSYYFLLWYYQNCKIISYLRAKNLSYFQLGYDELGLHPEKMMRDLFHYLDQPFEEIDLSSEGSKSHVLLGNPKKTLPSDGRASCMTTAGCTATSGCCQQRCSPRSCALTQCMYTAISGGKVFGRSGSALNDDIVSVNGDRILIG